MASFYDMIQYLQAIGVADVLLPFLLVFTVTFAIFQKSNILGEASKAKRYNVIVALVLGFSFVMPHIIWGTPDPVDHMLVTGIADPVEIVNGSLPSVSVVIIAIILVMLMLGIFGAEFNIGEGSGFGGFAVFFAIATVGYIFLTNAGYFGNGRFPAFLWFLGDPNTQSLLVVILVFGIIVWMITRDESAPTEEKDKFRNWVKTMGGRP